MALRISSPLSTFYHIPKTGGNSISQWLNFVGLNPKLMRTDLRGGNHFTPDYLFTYFNENPNDAGFKYCVVRNPWERVASAYNYKLNLRGTVGKKWLSDRNISNFDDFVWNWIAERPSCHTYAKHCDHVLRFETMKEDFKKIQLFYSCFIPLPPPPTNTPQYDFREFFKAYSYLIDIIGQTYSDDVSVYKYEYVETI